MQIGMERRQQNWVGFAYLAYMGEPPLVITAPCWALYSVHNSYCIAYF